jgi:hypothetical protein
MRLRVDLAGVAAQVARSLPIRVRSLVMPTRQVRMSRTRRLHATNAASGHTQTRACRQSKEWPAHPSSCGDIVRTLADGMDFGMATARRLMAGCPAPCGLREVCGTRVRLGSRHTPAGPGLRAVRHVAFGGLQILRHRAFFLWTQANANPQVRGGLPDCTATDARSAPVVRRKCSRHVDLGFRVAAP